MMNWDAGPQPTLHPQNILPYMPNNGHKASGQLSGPKFHFNRLLQLLISRNPDDGMNQIRMGKSYPLSLDAEIESELVFNPVNDLVKDGSLAGVAIAWDRIKDREKGPFIGVLEKNRLLVVSSFEELWAPPHVQPLDDTVT